MKEVLYSRQTLLNIEDSISELVRQNYFSNEDYAVQYVSDILQYFSLNFYNLEFLINAISYLEYK